MSKAQEPKIDELSIKDAFDELEKITEALEKGDVDLEKSLPQLKRGHELATYLKKKLQKLENEIEEITIGFDTQTEDTTN